MVKATERPDLIEVRDGRLIVDVALTSARPSGSGKNKVYFTTAGNQPINDEFKVGINLFRKQ